MEKSIQEKLDLLSEYQAQVDILAMQKRELIEAVKVPDEVLSIQREANKARQEYDALLARAKLTRSQEKADALSKIKDPEMPSEFVKALADARIEREKIEARFSSLEEIEAQATREAKAKIDAVLQEKTSDVYAQLAIRKQEIEVEFGDKLDALNSNISKLTDEIKADVEREGKSIKGKLLHAVYAAGRITWNTDKMEAWLVDHPFLREARKEGKPSVSIRKI